MGKIFLFLSIGAFSIPSWGFIDHLFVDAPCGCNKSKAGEDLARSFASELDGAARLRACLQCPSIKKFSDIEAYLTAFLKQLPPSQFRQDCRDLLTQTRIPNNKVTYRQALAEQLKEKLINSNEMGMLMLVTAS